MIKPCKIAALILGAAITISNVITIYADNEWTMQSPGVYQMIDGGSITGVVSRGVDVSRWQGSIDWKAAAADDVDFVMLGTRVKTGDEDPTFRTNAKEAAAQGIKLGAYIYSYAMTPEAASEEADFVINLIKDYPISYPVAYDVEDSGTQGTLSKEELQTIIETFCTKISDAGYYPIIYANDYWLTNKLDMSSLKYPVWVARYNVKHAYENPVMWQATSTGSVSGISGNVDIDFQYKSFTDVIPDHTWRTIAGTTYYYQDYMMQKDTWINDGTGWFYMNEEGTVTKGWLTDNKKKYYLSQEDGKMTTGWLKMDDKWHFFDGTGALASGWISDGRWYYLNQDGIMQTGWIKDGSSWYYMSTSSPDMSVGWRQVDNNWYYFGTSGNMLTGKIDVSGVSYYLDTDGHMLASTTVTIGQDNYSIDASGAMSIIEPETEAVETTEASAITDETSGASSETVSASSSSTEASSETISAGSSPTESGTQSTGGSTSQSNVETVSPTNESAEKGPGIK